MPGLVNGLVFPPAPPLSTDESQARIVASHERLVQALIGESDAAAHLLVVSLLEAGVRAETLLDDAFPRAARALGELWCADDADFYTVTVAMTRLHRLVHEVSAPFLAEQAFPGSAGRVLLCGIDGEQHLLGLSILAEFLSRDGWDVHLLSAVPASVLLDKVRNADYNLIGFSVAVGDKVSRLRTTIQRVRQVSRNRDIRILVGGLAITEDPTLCARLGADGSATDAPSTVREARRLRGTS
ncbi:MAG: B12-binding domain-containing protein [Gemmatimonadaceae bacterium]